MTPFATVGFSKVFFRPNQTVPNRDNDYYRARYYASNDARFMSPDWSAKVEPVPYAKLGDPQSLNLYDYVLDNPLSGVDPDGHEYNAADSSGTGSQDCGGGNTHELSTQTQEKIQQRQKQTAQQQNLSNAQNAAINNPNFQPNTPRRGITHCNQASCSVARAMHAPMGPLTDARGNPLLANQIRANLAKSGSGYHTVSAAEAAQLGGHGVLVFVTGPGHIATVAADQNQNLPGRGPIIANVGYKNGDMRLDYVFPKSDMPEVRFYTPNQ